jgi:hypothetical protein
MKHFFFETVWGGLLIILIGILKTVHTIKFTKPDPDSVLKPFASGLIAGIGAIILGIIIMVSTLF